MPALSIGPSGMGEDGLALFHVGLKSLHKK